MKSRMEKQKKHLVNDLNSVITCRLCEGYFIDATTLVECLHTFCRGCILRYFENSKTQCPVCPTVYKKKSLCFRSDTQIQALVYKLVPSLYVKEVQRREDFYRSTGVRAGSSCSDDSVIERERDMINETEEMISQCVGDKTQYFSPEDSISLSLEYYQAHLDTTDLNTNKKVIQNLEKPTVQTDIIIDENKNTTTTANCVVSDGTDSSDNNNKTIAKNNLETDSDKISDKGIGRVGEKRYLQCPAGVNMKHLQKFVRMKYGLTGDHRVDIIYKGEVLPMNFSLMDVAYSFKWEKKKPLKFFYRIFTPMKIRPIKIINTTLSTGGKQLQIVPVTSSNPIPHMNVEACQKPDKVDKKELYQETENEQKDKERHLAHLQLQSKSKAMIAEAKKIQKVPEKIVKECVFEYEEPDQEEIKRFAEKRDREWALQKKLEEETRPDEEYANYHFSKKRKKSKHSKNESNSHKKRKLHAEITSNEKTDLKLKVKITTNGHKHKHHKIENSEKTEISNKEKLLQMRQVRHKHMSGSSGDEKSQPAIPTIKLPKGIAKGYNVENPFDAATTYHSGEPEAKKKRESPKLKEHKLSVAENNNQALEGQTKLRIEPMIIKPVLTTTEPSSSKSSSTKTAGRSEVQSVKNVTKDLGGRNPTVQLERHELTERHAQKTFLKTSQPHPDKHPKNEKISQGKVEGVKTTQSMNNKVLPIGSINTNNKSLDRKIASLQQRCTIEPKHFSNNLNKDSNKTEKMVNFSSDKPKVMTPQYPPGFTVSKVESGVKRKSESKDNVQDKRPSLEITLISPPNSTATPSPKPAESKPVTKRPPPGTIPLERIKNLKSGISIIPKTKMLERCDNNGVLDLSKPNKSPENSIRASPPNGLNSLVNRQINSAAPRPVNSPGKSTPETKTNVQLSNLQMLSKVAIEHSSLNKLTPNNLSKTRPQLPNLQTIRLPSMSPNSVKGTMLQRMPPKLNEIQKFRPSNPQIRNLRPNQNQNIRNIPNPSLLMNRQQNQNRLVSGNSNPIAGQNNSSEKKDSSPKPQTPATASMGQIVSKEVTSVKSAILEQNVSEKKEISV